MKKKYYIVTNDQITSKTDGQRHHIRAAKLMQLYGVTPQECMVVNLDRPETYRGMNLDELKSLSPRFDGDYPTCSRQRIKVYVSPGITETCYKPEFCNNGFGRPSENAPECYGNKCSATEICKRVATQGLRWEYV